MMQEPTPKQKALARYDKQFDAATALVWVVWHTRREQTLTDNLPFHWDMEAAKAELEEARTKREESVTYAKELCEQHGIPYGTAISDAFHYFNAMRLPPEEGEQRVIFACKR